VTVPLEGDPCRSGTARICARGFDRAYEVLYGVRLDDVDVEVVSWRTAAHGGAKQRAISVTLDSKPGVARTRRQVHFRGRDMAVDVYDRRSLARDQRIAGPVLIEERETTIYVLAGWAVTVHADGSLIATSGARGASRMDGIELEIMWGNLISIVSEQAKALQRIAFSPIVREAGDLATALFDTEARMVAQAITGTPGHINSLGAAAKNMLTAIPPSGFSRAMC